MTRSYFECFYSLEIVRYFVVFDVLRLREPRSLFGQIGLKIASGKPMNGELLARLIEEMTDLKIQHYAEANLKPNPEVAKVLEAKRETDRRRLEQIKAEMARILNNGVGP